MDWFLYDRDLRHERVKQQVEILTVSFVKQCNYMFKFSEKMLYKLS